MKITIVISILGLLVLAGAPKPVVWPLEIPRGWPKPVYDFSKNPLTKEGFVLGRKIFYDVRLSRDSSLSCASCHQQFGAFATYEHNLSHGVNNSLTTRNAPALQNLAWEKEYMWDGSITHLDLQPLAPITAENEMGETLSNVIRKLQHDRDYPALFKAAFGDTMIDTKRMNMALSQFMLRLISSNSKYDKVIRGEATFILPEQTGYALFQQKCSQCHTEPLFTDLSYRNIGLSPDNTLNDYGRMKITGDRADSMKFRVPSLRNVAITSPYGHDGRFFSLLNVFEHYRKNLIAPIKLSNYEIGQLTAFLYTLTDSSFLKDPQFAPEGYAITPNFIHRH